MALIITEECINCGACETECPNEAITEDDDIYIIDPNLCSECIGAFEEPQCAEACPVDCCVPDSNHVETKEELQTKYDRIHSK